MSSRIASRSVFELVDTEVSTSSTSNSSESLISTSAVDTGFIDRSQHSTKNTKVPVIVGCVVGGVVVIALVAAIAWFLWYVPRSSVKHADKEGLKFRRRRFKRERAYEDTTRWQIEGMSISNTEPILHKHNHFTPPRMLPDDMAAMSRHRSFRASSTSPSLLPSGDSYESRSVTPASSSRSLPLLQRPINRQETQQSASTFDIVPLLQN